MSVIGSNIIAGASGTVETAYQIARSLRFNSADSAYLNRTPASAGNRKTWTWSGWVKRSSFTSGLFQAYISGNDLTAVAFGGAGATTLFVQDYSSSGGYNLVWETPAVFRDFSAWYHLIVAYDTTQASSANAVKVYVNGVQQTLTFTANAGAYVQNRNSYVNSTNTHGIGIYNALANYANAYITEVNFIDGQALTPSSFGETDSATGVWVPKAYTGTYGTNGFWLKFDDNSGVTATTLGKDSSGNGNNWTPNNFSVTAGVGNDSLVDSPTWYGTDTGAGGEVRGNYPTFGPLWADAGAAPMTIASWLSNGNLTVTKPAATQDWRCAGNFALPKTGKWYWEIDAVFTGLAFLGMADIKSWASGTNGTIFNNGYFYVSNGNKATSVTGSGSTYTGATSYVSGTTVGVAYDADAGTITFYKNGVSQGVAYTGISTATDWYPAVSSTGASGTATYNINFGQRVFAYAAPSGHLCLCATNFPTPAVVKPSTNFNALAYSGDGTSPRTISGVGFQPDLVWVKNRGVTFAHTVHDAVRGAGSLKALYTSSTTSESGGDTNLYGYLSAFASDGFTVTAGTGATPQAYFNTNGNSFIAWTWKANGAGVSNTAGSITSTVSANTAAGISVVTFAVPASGVSGTIGHGLGVTPAMIIAKGRGLTDNWVVWHKNATTTTAQYLRLNTTDAVISTAGAWGAAVPNSTVFGILGGTLLAASQNAVAYCFAEVAGFSKFGSYTGNGNANGPFVYCGFRPRWVLLKRTDTAGFNWVIFDAARNDSNLANNALFPNLSNAEDPTGTLDVLSNGFKWRGVGTTVNASGGTYIFAAFAEAPFNYSRAR